MRSGTLFLVVGPSGAGKDALMAGARPSLEATGRYVFARRTITRPAGSPGEDHEAATPAAFEARRAAGQFLIDWEAHGLSYGLPATLGDELAAGRNIVANGSRAVIGALASRVSRLVVVEVTAPPDVLAQRIAGRGREDEATIRQRLARIVEPPPDGIRRVEVANDGALTVGVERFVAAVESVANYLSLKRMPLIAGRRHCAYLPIGGIIDGRDYLGPGKIELTSGEAAIRTEVQAVDRADLLAPNEIGLSGEAFEELGLPEGSEIAIRRTPSPESREALMHKLRGGTLSEAQYHLLIRDIVESRYPDSEVAAFLVAATQRLADEEVTSLARVRTRFSQRINWPDGIVVDKHSMGGIPGSRITLIVVPIIAAHGGFLMPKTSSRAITSAAGTADAMEVLADVDLDSVRLRRCVEQARACIAWNGRLNHSIVDDVMNAITRPLGIDSNRWSVASILSKKFTAGSTHVIVDLPYGPRAKLRSLEEATDLARLFELVGRGLGLVVEAHPTDGTRPIGRGIGPALEVRDVRWVLSRNPQAPADLVGKALFFASRILAWDPQIASVEAGHARAVALLESGAALASFEAIIDAQGRHAAPAAPGLLVHTVRAARSGVIREIDGWAIAGLARRAGAPFDKSAGVDLKRGVGDRVEAGEPLFAIHAGAPADLDEAKRLAESSDCYLIDQEVAAAAR
ncbi:phosphonate metabolism protein/1,5-bisphosphokinase (PRPP-forming) PhnN [uncultured Bosea sp.]|uniref:phosphonate metabolism protein/1,5-bisphosphokinase (PRPP-forming) PhnN n=1 Tax=uncultured Bosea sp. TaxID=211457 RepID=UPI0025F6EB77|nr:phosphonate metabolism protein/1,5-bisphosphokinase (PRPP-forming) PhnN [uncultured Bosea sp.]